MDPPTPPLRIGDNRRDERSRWRVWQITRARSTHLDTVPSQELSVRLRVPGPHVEQRVDLERRVELRRLEV